MVGHGVVTLIERCTVKTLAFDTETSDLCLEREKPDHPGQPHVVELGCVLYDHENAERTTVNVIIRPTGWTIAPKAQETHGISLEMAYDLGIPAMVAMAMFSNLVKQADRTCGHNITFDLKVMMAEFHRIGRPFPPTNPRCTKDLAEPVLKLPPTERMKATGMGHKFKSPTLTECVRFLFDEELVGAHGALADARACGRVLFELERRAKETVLPHD
jgi:DNA polymerase III subunit epsilon